MDNADTPNGQHAVSLRLAAEPAAAARARAALNQWSGSIERHVFEQARLLISEVVSGCVSQADDSQDLIALDISVSPRIVRVEVSHRCAAPAPARRVAGAAEPAGGWTLHMLRELADRWGVRRQTRSTVWFEIDRA
jgi:acetyl-CoA acetyltransferase